MQRHATSPNPSTLQEEGEQLLSQLNELQAQEAAAYSQAEQVYLSDADLSEEGQVHLLNHTLPQHRDRIAQCNSLASTLAAALSQTQQAWQAEDSQPTIETSTPTREQNATSNLQNFWNQAWGSVCLLFDKTWLTRQFITAYTPTLSPEAREQFQQTIAPILEEKLPQADRKLQQEVIEYFFNVGSFYPVILRQFPPSAWVRESLLLDIVYPALLQDHQLILDKFQAQWQATTRTYTPKETTALLRTLSDKALDLLEICEVLEFFPPSPRQALQLLQQDNWRTALRQAWLTPRLHSWTPQARVQLTNTLAPLHWEAARMHHVLAAIQKEQDFQSIQYFLSCIAHPSLDEDMHWEILHNTPAQEGISQVQAWSHALTSTLLKQQIAQQFPGHVIPLQERLVGLLRHTCTYAALSALLAALEQASAPHYQQAKHLIEALDILSDYQLPPTPYTQALRQLYHTPPQEWPQQTHQNAIKATFLPSHERSVAELIDEITAQAPPGTCNQYTLMHQYEEVLSAYTSTSSILESNKPICQWNKQDLQAWARLVKSRTQDAVSQAELVAAVKQAVKLHKGFTPRATQLLSILILRNTNKHQGRLAQINTGEGKSTIVAMLAALQALQGHQVDVVTTSPELAVPEVKEQTPFFSMLGLSVGENSNHATKQAAYQKDIVYGTPGDFQGDILRQRLGQDLRGNRKFDVAIVDEVDSMLFDQRSHSIRLAGNTPAMNHLEPLLAAAWRQVNTIYKRFITQEGKTYFAKTNFEVQDGVPIFPAGQTFEECTEPVADPEAFLKERTQAYLHSLIRDLNETEQKQWDTYQDLYLRAASLQKDLDNLRKAIAEAERNKASASSIQAQKDKANKKQEALEKLAQALNNADWTRQLPIIEIPQHLKEFTKHQIPQWVHNALLALCVYKKEKHYDVKGTKIVPIDYGNTGVLQKNVVWSDGLAQFLQIKEGVILTPEGVSTNFLSTPGFFKKYGSSLYGLTGTLGGAATQSFLQEIYGVDTVVIPPYKHREIVGNASSRYLCKELPAQILATPAAWEASLIATTLRHAKHGQGVLVICKYIHQVKQLAKQLAKHHDASKIFTYTGQKQFDKPQIAPGTIVLATNIAGRGTDLKTTEAVEAHGGLHVCISFLPDTYRVELQNAGRTAREGKKGSAQLVLHEPGTPSIESLREERDAQESLAIETAKKEVKGMLLQDELFSDFSAIEDRILPTTSECTKLHEYRLISTAWQGIKKHIATLYKQASKQAGRRLLKKMLKDELADFSCSDHDKVRPVLEKAIQDSILPAHLDQAAYEAAVFEQFCESCKDKVSPEVLACLRAGNPYAPEGKNNAGGLYERKGVEERWGLWFKCRTSTDKDVLKEELQSFASTLEKDAADGSLIHNPYFYVLKGNELLADKCYYTAITAYERAISLDPRRSVNARYNKARAMLGQEKNKHYHQEAKKELRQAQDLLEACYKPTLLNFHVLVGQQDAENTLSAHVQHQINILSEQADCIAEALKVLEAAQCEDRDVLITE